MFSIARDDAVSKGKTGKNQKITKSSFFPILPVVPGISIAGEGRDMQEESNTKRPSVRRTESLFVLDNQPVRFPCKENEP